MSTTMPCSLPPADRRAGWGTRLDHVAEEVLDVFQDRFFWHRISDIANANQVVRDNPFVPSLIGTLFYRRAIVALRTVVDAGQRGREHETDSLVTVLNDIIAHPQDLVVDAYTGMQMVGANIIDLAAVRADVARLKQTAAAIKRYSNQYITHLARSPSASVLRVEEIEAAIDLVGEMLQKYMLLITGKDLEMETRVLFDWTASLTVAWLPPHNSEVLKANGCLPEAS